MRLICPKCHGPGNLGQPVALDSFFYIKKNNIKTIKSETKLQGYITTFAKPFKCTALIACSFLCLFLHLFTCQRRCQRRRRGRNREGSGTGRRLHEGERIMREIHTVNLVTTYFFASLKGQFERSMITLLQ